MQVQIEEVSPVEKKLAVEIPWPKVQEKLEAAYRELGKGVQVKGFRKGKVPRDVIVRLYGKQVQMEVAKELVQESFLAAASEHKLEPVAEPVVEDAIVRSGQPFKYSARIEVRGDVKVGEWEKLPVPKGKVAVSDADVDAAVEHRRQQHTEYRPITGRTSTANTDVVMLAMTGTLGEHKLDRPEISIDLTDTENDPLPGLRAALTGVALDAKDLAITLTIPEDFAQKEVAGKTANLLITVKDAREKVVPALDDEFAKDTGEADTLAELKTKVRGELEKQAGEQVDREFRDAALKEFIKRNQIPVAPALIERGIDSQIQRTRYSLAMQGIDITKAGIDLRGMRDRLRDSAIEEIRGQLLLEALADDHSVEISYGDVETRVNELAAMREKPPQKLRAEMERDGSLDSLRWRLRQEKALDLVVSRATITEAPPVEAQPAE
jgi:trigger factor